MGRKKYFCDFCSRFFNDDRNTRVKHLNSAAHKKAKTEHYNMFIDPEIILKENSLKKPCRKFQTEGYCQYGSSCIYSHYTPYDLDLIQQEISRVKMLNSDINIPPTEAFCQKYDEIKKKKITGHATSIWSHELPSNLFPIPDNLPISMQPFNINIFKNAELSDWG